MKTIQFIGLIMLCSILFSACRVTKYDILFDVEGNLTNNALFEQMKVEAEKNYLVERFDEVSFRLFTNKGELLIDPDGQLRVEGTFNPYVNRNNLNLNNPNNLNDPNNLNNFNPNVAFQLTRTYTVQDDGKVYLPLVGGLDVAGRKIYQLDSLISVAYHQYYENAYARTSIENRRVVVMGALGNKVIKLPYEGMHLAEVLVMAGGELNRNTRNEKIKIIRNVLSDQPIIQSVNLSTWEGVQKANMQIQPNDIIYVQPRRRNLENATENVQAITSILGQISGFITSAITLWVVLNQN